jgi:hypothetical protein
MVSNRIAGAIAVGIVAALFLTFWGRPKPIHVEASHPIPAQALIDPAMIEQDKRDDEAIEKVRLLATGDAFNAFYTNRLPDRSPTRIADTQSLFSQALSLAANISDFNKRDRALRFIYDTQRKFGNGGGDNEQVFTEDAKNTLWYATNKEAVRGEWPE